MTSPFEGDAFLRLHVRAAMLSGAVCLPPTIVPPVTSGLTSMM